MGWLGDRLRKLAEAVAGAPPIDFIFIPSLTPSGIPGIGEKLDPDECYIELYLESLRLERARRFATRFNALVYSFVTLSREGEQRVQLTAVSKPEKLANLDRTSLDRVITISKQMIGATAFRGGPVSLEFGLFSVKSENLLTSVLDYVTKISAVAGISYVGAIKPFVPLITEGMDLIAGQSQDTALEVGIDADLKLDLSCVAAIIALPLGSIDITKLSLDADRRLLLDRKPLDCGYAVFSLRRTIQKPDFGEIPELKERYAAIQSAIRSGKEKDARDALVAFRLAALASADLIPSDARRLVQKAKERLEESFPPGGFAAVRTDLRMEKLADIGLYD